MLADIFLPLRELSVFCIHCLQWRSNRVCKSCSASGPIAVGGPDEPCVGKKGMGLWNPSQPCYATLCHLQYSLLLSFLFKQTVTQYTGWPK